MANARFVTENYIDDVTESNITVSPSVTNTLYDIDNVKVTDRSVVFRSDDTSNQEISIVFNGAVDISAFIIGRHNFSSLIQYQVVLYSNSNFTGLLYDTTVSSLTASETSTDYWEFGEFAWGTVPWGANKLDTQSPTTINNFRNINYWMPSLVTGVQSAKIYLTSTATPDIPYYEIGRLIFGEYFSPTYNISYGEGLEWKDNTSQYRPSNGTLHSDIATSNREITFSLNTMDVTDRVTLVKKFTTVGLHKDFYISLFPESPYQTKITDFSGIVKFTRVPKYTNFRPGFYKSDYVVEEV